MAKPKAAAAKAFYKPAETQAFYNIFSVSPSPAEDGSWEVLYFVSGDADLGDVTTPCRGQALKDLITAGYTKAGATVPRLQDEESKNLYAINVATEADATKLASELVYIFQAAGLKPMSEETGAYAPKAPVATASKPGAKGPKA